MQLCVHLTPRRASERFSERLLEVVAQECVQDRVHGRVGVRQTLGQQHHGEGDGGLAGVRGHEGQPELGAPVREPAQDVDSYHAQYQVGNLPVGAFLFFASILRTDVPQAADHQEVEEENQNERYGESKSEGVQTERHFTIHVRALGPVNVAVDVSTLLQRTGVHVYRYHKQCRQCPRCKTYELGDEWCAISGRTDWMTYCHVAISTHDGQKQAASELIDARGGHIDLAHHSSERPRVEYHRGQQEWQTKQVHLIRECQVENIHVGNRLHLGEAEDHVDDQCVSAES